MIFDLFHAVARWLEDVAGRHAHFIALLEAVSTTAAVIVALWVSYAAKRANQPRLRASVQVMQIIYGDGRPIDDAPTYVTVLVTNVGPVPVRLHSNLFSYHLRFTKNPWWLVMPVDEAGDGPVTRRQYPFVLLPHTSETIFLSYAATVPARRWARSAAATLSCAAAHNGDTPKAIIKPHPVGSSRRSPRINAT